MSETPSWEQVGMEIFAITNPVAVGFFGVHVPFNEWLENAAIVEARAAAEYDEKWKRREPEEPGEPSVEANPLLPALEIPRPPYKEYGE